MKVEPMAGDVDGHGELEPEHVFGVEVAEGDEQAHRATSVGELIKHRAELRRCDKKQ